MIVVVLLIYLGVITFTIIRQRDLFAAVMLSSIFSLLAAALFTILDAVDVAFTEASVGAGISTVLLVATLAITGRQEKFRRSGVAPLPFLLAVITAAALIYGTLDLPAFGDPGAPIHHHLRPRFIEQSAQEVGPPNIVTSILASYRGYDTFGEATVIFTAAVGVLLLLSALKRRDDPPPEPAVDAAKREDGVRRKDGVKREDGVKHHYIVRASLKPLIPFIMIFGLYVQFHGDYGPGGGFQAGVIFAAAIILYTLVFGLRSGTKLLPWRRLEILIASGVMLYGAVGLVAMLRGGDFLDYNALADDPLHGQHWGILLVELGVGLTVAAVMVTLFFLFAARKRS